MFKNDPIAFKKKFICFAITLGVVAVVMIIPDPTLALAVAPFFPAPLISTPFSWIGLDVRSAFLGEAIIGWLIYAVLLISYFAIRNGKACRWIFFILCVFLLFNMAGCHVELDQMSRMGC